MAHETLSRQREQPRAPGERSLGLPQSTALIWGPFLMSAVAGLVGIPVYLAQRAHMTGAERI